MTSNDTEDTSSPLPMNYAGKDVEASELLGIPSGIVGLDRITNCWKKSSLYVVAGAPSMGCTSLLLAFMRSAVLDSQRGVVFFSLQLRADKLLTKWISQEIGVPYAKIETGQLSEAERGKRNGCLQLWGKGAGTLAKINDVPHPTIGSIVADCKRLRASGTELFLIDSINRIALGKRARAFCSNREQELAYIVRRLKTLAYELDAPVIVVSQLSRAGSGRNPLSRPRLTDLRDSGAIENEADVVVLLYREEYYNLDYDEMGNSTKGLAELIVAKNTFGKTETAKVQFLADCGLFKDVEYNEWLSKPSKTLTEKNFTPEPFPKNSIRLGQRKGGPPSLEEPPF